MSQVIARHRKAPGEQLDYGIDYSEVLARNEAIENSAWSISPTGALSQVASSQSEKVATIIVAGGTEGETYELVNRVTTNSSPPRIFELAILISVR